MLSKVNPTIVRVFLMERDFYARQTLISYLSWDRRTRVVDSADSPSELLHGLQGPSTSPPDVILFDTSCVEDDPNRLTGWLWSLRPHAEKSRVLCLAQRPDREMALAAGNAGAGGFLTRDRVGFSVAGALVWALDAKFLVTEDVARCLDGVFDRPFSRAQVLPARRQYPTLTARVEQALHLCVLGRLSADVAADEMGVSTNTVRTYVKEGYRILESYDDTIYPNDLSAAERAFMRYTALEASHLRACFC